MLEHKDWKGTTGGMPWMQRALIKWLAVCPPVAVYAVLVFIVPGYMLIGHKGYMAQYHFFREAMGEGVWLSFWHVYVNHFRFGQIIIDRFAAFGGRKFHFSMENALDYEQLCLAPEGILQLSCHAGNYELAGYSLKQPQKSVHALVFWGETETMMQNRARLFAPNGVYMVPVKPDMSHIFELNNALRDGNIASMPGDRVFGSPRSVACEFFGRKAQFPLGPFSLAVSREVPVVTVFVMKSGINSYNVILRRLYIDASKLTQTGVLRKREAIMQLAQNYATTVEEVIRRYPTQWFNYFDFWK